MKHLELEDFAIEGAGGGGCFVAGTQIATPEGDYSIEEIAVGDTVWCFDEEDGTMTYGKVYKKHIHQPEENNANLFTFYFDECDPISVTGNHYIWTANGDFEYAANFEVGDCMVNEAGQPLRITHIEEQEPNVVVYNFEVDPHATYIANGIRVHNGGGGSSKSSSGGTARAAKEAPNTLSSSASAVVVELISEGEFVGLVNGAKSIYFDGTPVQNTDGTYNFDKFVYDSRVGLPTQEAMPGFPDVEAEFGVNVEVSIATGAVERLLAQTADACRVTILVPSLYLQDPSTGDVNGHSFSLAVDRRLGTSGAWVNALSKTVSGKTMSSYEESYRIERPTGTTGAWQIRVRRVSADDANANAHSAFRWSHYTEIQDVKLTYPNTAYIGLKVDAKSTGGNLPKRSYRVKGIKVQVPSNYNPTTRAYTGSWNGQFKIAWTDNPAWIVYDLLINPRYGLGIMLDNTQIDPYSFYDAARYNDELVSDGDGGTEPRFTFNGVINTRQDAWKLVQAVASSCRSVVYYGSGKARLLQDRPTATTAIVNKTDVIEGMFEYASTSLQMRHPIVQVTYNDKDDRYLPATIVCEDTDSVVRYGYNVKETVAYGATTEGQARRLGLWTLYTELGTTESVKFRTGLNMATRLSPGNVIKLLDEDMRGAPFGGRIVTGTTTSATLDRAVTFVAGQTYTLEFIDADGKTIRSGAITNVPGTYTTISTSALVAAPTVGSSWIITSQDFEGRLYRVYSIVEHAPAEFEITAFSYNPDKYTVVDQAVNPETWKPFTKDLSICPAPSDVVWSRETTTDSYGRRVVNLRLNWTQVDKDYVNNYLISYRRDGKEVTNDVMTAHTEFIIPNVQAGGYEAFIYAVNLSNVRSPVTITNYYNDLSGGISPMYAPVNLETKGVAWVTKDLTFVWEQNPGNTNTGDGIFKSYYIEICDPDTFNVIRVEETTNTEFAYTFDYNRIDTDGITARRSLLIKVYNKDSYNRLSLPVTATMTNPVPGAATIQAAGGYKSYSVIVGAPVGASDLAGVYVVELANELQSPILANVVYKGPNTNVVIESANNNAVVRAGYYDQFNDNFDEVYWSDAVTVGVTQIITTVDSVEGYKFLNLIFHPGNPGNFITWSGATALNTLDGTTQAIPAGSASYSGNPVYLYYDHSDGIIHPTTSMSSAVGLGKVIMGVYNGGKDFSGGNGDAFIDGGKVLAQTIAANAIVAGTITSNEIATGGITANNIAANTITGNKLVTNSAVITTTAQMANAVVETATIKDLQVTTLKIGDNAVTDFVTTEWTGATTLARNDVNVLTDLSITPFSSVAPVSTVALSIAYSTEGDLMDHNTAAMPAGDFNINAHLVFRVIFEYQTSPGVWVGMPWYTTEDIVAGSTNMNMYQVATINNGTKWMTGPGMPGDTYYYGPIRDWQNQPSVYGETRRVNKQFVIPTPLSTYPTGSYRVRVAGWHYVKWTGLNGTNYTPGTGTYTPTTITQTIVTMMGVKK